MKYNTKNYDYLIVGAGPYGSVFAYEAAKRGKKSLIIERRAHIGGNMYTHKEHGINVHDYGAHVNVRVLLRGDDHDGDDAHHVLILH